MHICTRSIGYAGGDTARATSGLRKEPVGKGLVYFVLDGFLFVCALADRKK